MGSEGRTISRAAAGDLEAIVPLFHAYRGFFAGRRDEDESRAFLAARIARDESVVFAAWRDGEAEGFIQLYPLWSSWYCRRIWFLSDLYVAESSRQHGVGKALVRRVVDYARETDAASIMVELPHSEPHLRVFYESLGFHKDDVFDLARHSLG